MTSDLLPQRICSTQKCGRVVKIPFSDLIASAATGNFKGAKSAPEDSPKKFPLTERSPLSIVNERSGTKIAKSAFHALMRFCPPL